MQPGGYIMKEVRYNEILKTLESQEVVKVTDLASQLNVTDMTIRRDLQELEEDGLLIRTHGGARSIPSPLTDEQELSHMIKKKINPAEKQYIARIIAKNIKSNRATRSRQMLGNNIMARLCACHYVVDDADGGLSLV